MIQNQDYIQEFIEEAKGHIEKVEAILLLKDNIRNDNESINEIFRAVHSIKGTAGFFGLKNIVSLAHAMENVFGDIRIGKIQLDNDIVDIMLSANDCMKAMVDDVLNSEEMEVTTFLDQLNNIILLSNGDATKEEEFCISITNRVGGKFCVRGSICSILKDGLAHGHKLYEIKISMNKDLLNYSDGPVKLFNKIQAVGMVIDTVTDHSEINSFDDILQAVSMDYKDIHLGIIVTSVLEKSLFSEAVEIPMDNISEMFLENQETKTDDNTEIELVQESIVKQKEIKNSVPIEEAINIENKVEESKQIKVEDSIRVHVSVLNDLLNMASEMVLGRNQLLRTLEDYKKSIPGLSSILQNIDRLTSGMQGKIMQTRMQPVSIVFSKFPRIIRDLSKNLGKEIELQLEGEEVELDKSVIEALTDPLTHLIRNSADHGLETPEEREANGKPRAGNIKLHAFHEGGYVNIDVIDDGKGIDVEKLVTKALEKGVVRQEELSRMSEKEQLSLVFKPGFSTAEKVSDISGRGVGMDVVKTNIEKLGGAIEIFTVRQGGTTIRLMLPLTIAIIRSLIVEVKGIKFALPEVNLKEIVRIRQGDNTRKIEFIHDSEVLRLRGKLLPIIHLADILGIKDKANNSSNIENNGVVRILVLQMGTRQFGVVVDSIFASEETLVKPLPVYLKECECYSGVTIMGDGQTAMILDIEGLIRLSDLKFREEENEANTNHQFEADKLIETQNLLFFKCKGNETFAMDLSMISRVEEINEENIERIGEKEYIQFRGDSLRVIHPENYLPVNNGTSENTKKYVLIPKLVSHPIGIIVEKIIDNVNIHLKLNTQDAKVHGLLGTAIYEDRIVLLINIYELFEMADPDHYSKKELQVENNATLLLVEDTPFFQRIEKEYLEGVGYDVILAGNGKEALELLESNKIDCVISDIQMPIMDGITLVKKIRENSKFQNLPVIAVTSMAGQFKKEQGLESGFDFYESKLDRDILVKTVQKALEKPRRKVV